MGRREREREKERIVALWVVNGTATPRALNQRAPNPSQNRPAPRQVFLQAQLEEGGCLTDAHLAALFLGPGGFVTALPDLAEDVPKAPVLAGRMLGSFAAAGHGVGVRAICDAMLDDPPRQDEDAAEGDPPNMNPPLIDAEQALPLVAALLARWREAAGDDGAAAREAWSAAGLEWAQLLPDFAREESDVQRALEKAGGTWISG
jgi:hypothetical protein